MSRFYANGKKRTVADWLVLICLIFAAFASLASDQMNTYALYAVLPLAFVVSFLQSGRLFQNKYLNLLLALYLWEVMSLLWAVYQDMSMRELHRILGAFMVSYIITVQTKRGNVIVGLYIVFFVLLINAWIYASTHSLIVTDFAENERLNDQKLNANTMAYYTTYVTFGTFIIAQVCKSGLWKKVFSILFFAMIPLSFFTALTTASRQILIIQVPFIILLLWQRYLQHSKRRTKLLFAVSLLAAIVVFAPYVESTYKDSFLAQRADNAIAEDTRTALIGESIRVGLDHFPLGVGAGNYIMFSKTHHFSHNSYTELFANVGIVGLLFYLFLVFGFVKCQWKRYKRTKDKVFAYFLIFGIIYVVDQFFYVFYIDQWLISFYTLIATHSDTYYKQTYLEIKNQ